MHWINLSILRPSVQNPYQPSDISTFLHKCHLLGSSAMAAASCALRLEKRMYTMYRHGPITNLVYLLECCTCRAVES